MKKRFIALLLCCVMLLTLSPSLISAASATDISGTTQSTEGQVPSGEATNPSGTETSTGLQPDATSGSNPPADPQPDANNGNTSAEVENGGSSEENSGKDPASMTDAELYAHVKQLTTDEAIEAFLKQLPEARVNALIAYAQAQEPAVVPKTVVFTDAGPFMPPVTVERVLRRYAARAAAEEPADNGNGLELSKTATANGNNIYTIRMEAYTTGTVTTSTKTVPVDIVLVLDQSGSMAYDFSGNSTNTNTDRRQYAMKQAVNNFIDEVAKKYTTDADHRMAIVTFGSNASTLQGWTFVNEAGKGTLQGKINGLPVTPSGATNVAAGMTQAETLMGSGYSYTGANTQRQKVVIVFTDGVPTTNTDFDTTVATNAIASAKRLKDAGATVYTIGIFSGANPDELYGASGFDRNSNGSVGSDWSDFSFWMIGDIKNYDIPAGNRFLNYLSSNFSDATEIGLIQYKETFLGIGYRGWKITRNFESTNSNYYLTAKDSASLDEIFQTISENIQAANIDLGSETVVKDTVSPYFDLPANTSDIKLYTADYNGKSFGADTAAPSTVSAEIKNGTVSVTGFDFNANFVSETKKSDDTYGKKLIIEFTVTPKDGFIGGNDVPTNDWANSAVYDKSGAEVEKFADANTTPTVNVPIKDVTVTAEDKNVYLLGGLTAAQLKSGAVVKCGDVELKLNESNYGLETWQTAYANITVKLYGADGTTEITSLTNLTDDTTYTLSVTVASKTTGTDADGTPATAKTGANSPVAKINVFKPELTFQDSEVYYGDAVQSDFSGNKTSEVWKHNTTISTDEGFVMTGEKPTLTLTCTPDSTKIIGGKINAKQDIGVDVTVKIGTTDVTDKTTFQHTNCTGKTCTLPAGAEFLLHVKTCQLTIAKAGGADNEPYVFTVKKDGANYTEVTIVGNSSVTIYELPVGAYTIEEDTGWSWRFTPTIGGGVTLSTTNASGSITCANAKTNDYWLNGFSAVVKNIFGIPTRN